MKKWSGHFLVGNPSVIILGAGAAGLSAAHELSEARVEVLVLEARQRLGGRIYTADNSHGAPVELGAEFIHGKPPVLCTLIERAGLAIKPMLDRHWLWQNGKLRE